jgi:hypothetical protein
MAFLDTIVPFYFQPGCCAENFPIINFSAFEFEENKSHDLQA